MPSRLSLILLIAATACSGAAALTYELLWSRSLVVVLGNATDATAAVLAGFMLGMALGATLSGRLRLSARAGLLVYAGLEVVLALFALVAPEAISGLGRVGTGGTLPFGYLVRLLGAELLIGLPSLLLGAALPLLVRTLAPRHQSLPGVIGVLYGINTLGAVMGALGAGFFLVPTLGIDRASTLAGGGSALAAVLALFTFILTRAPSQAAREPEPSHAEASVEPRWLLVVPLVLTATSGFVTLGAEILWARLLTFVFGHDGQALSALLALVLIGLGLGGLLHRLLHRVDQLRLAVALLGLQGLTLFVSFVVTAEFVIARGRDPFHLDASARFADSAWLELSRALALTPLLILLPALLAGIAFPAACSLYRRGRGSAGDVGDVTLVNGLGSAAGSVLVALFGVELFGLRGGLVALALLPTLVAGLALFIIESRRGLVRRLGAAVAPVLALLGLLSFCPTDQPRRMLLAVVGPHHQQLLFYEEGRVATVSVLKNRINGERQLLVNAVNEVTTRLVHDQSFKLMGQLAPLLHPAPKQGLMICLGAGLAAGSALTHPLERLDVVDLSASVARGARYFAVENNGVLDDPRLALTIGDGRQYLLNTRNRYDVAIVDSTHPKSVDSWILYTEEFYRALGARMNPGGIVLQWLPLHGLSEREFKIVVKTFLHVFPHATLWANVGFETYGQVAYAKLVARVDGPLQIDRERLRRRLAEPRIRADLERYGMAEETAILDALLAGPVGLAQWTAGLPLQTDDQPFLPYTTRYATGRRMLPNLLSAVHDPGEVLTLDPELAHATRVTRLLLGGHLAAAQRLAHDSLKLRLFDEQQRTSLPYYRALAERSPGDPPRLFEAALQLGQFGDPDRARALLHQLVARNPQDFRSRINLGFVLLGMNQPALAAREFQEAARELGPQPHLLQGLAEVALAEGEPGLALRHAEVGLARAPHHLPLWLTQLEAALRLRDFERATKLAQQLRRDEPFLPEPDRALGLALLAEGRLKEALVAFERAVKKDPNLMLGWLDSATAHLQADQPETALTRLARALELLPEHPKARELELTILARLQRWEALSDRATALLELSPNSAVAARELGRALLALGQETAAREALCLAHRLTPRDRELQALKKSLGEPNELCR